MIERTEWLERRVQMLEQALAASEARLSQLESALYQVGGSLGLAIGGGASIRRARATTSVGPASASGATLGSGSAVFQSRSGTSLSDTADAAFTVYNGTDKTIATNSRLLIAGVDGGDSWEVVRVFSCSNLS